MGKLVNQRGVKFFLALRSNIIEKTKKIAKPVCSCGAQVESFKQKKANKSGDTATLNITKKCLLFDADKLNFFLNRLWVNICTMMSELLSIFP